MEELIKNGIQGRMHPDGGAMTFEEAVKDMTSYHSRIMKLHSVDKKEARIIVLKMHSPQRVIKVNCFGEIV